MSYVLHSLLHLSWLTCQYRHTDSLNTGGVLTCTVLTGLCKVHGCVAMGASKPTSPYYNWLHGRSIRQCRRTVAFVVLPPPACPLAKPTVVLHANEYGFAVDIIRLFVRQTTDIAHASQHVECTGHNYDAMHVNNATLGTEVST